MGFFALNLVVNVCSLLLLFPLLIPFDHVRHGFDFTIFIVSSGHPVCLEWWCEAIFRAWPWDVWVCAWANKFVAPAMFIPQTCVPFLSISCLRSVPLTLLAGMDVQRDLSQFRVQTLDRGDGHDERLDKVEEELFEERHNRAQSDEELRRELQEGLIEERLHQHQLIEVVRRQVRRSMDYMEHKLCWSVLLAFLLNLLFSAVFLAVGHIEMPLVVEQRIERQDNAQTIAGHEENTSQLLRQNYC